jgi:hypothetical protein
MHPRDRPPEVAGDRERGRKTGVFLVGGIPASLAASPSFAGGPMDTATDVAALAGMTTSQNLLDTNNRLERSVL